MKPRPFRLERYFAQHEFSAKYLLCSSDCESITIKDLLQMAPDAAKELFDLKLGYTETLGHPELRKEIAKLYKQTPAENILVHSGAEEAIFNFMASCLSSSDHVVVNYPNYQSHEELARTLGCRISRWEGQTKENWRFSVSDLKSLIAKETKALVVCFPHNPTGAMPSEQEWFEVIELCRKHNLLLFSDEVYRGLEYSDREPLPAACDLYENAISLNVMSKAWGLAGLRIGWIATQNKDVYKAMASYKDYTTICNSAPSELLARIALQNSALILKKNKEILKHNLILLENFMTRYKDLFQWLRPEAGPIAFPKFLGSQPVTEFCEHILQNTGVLLLPGSLITENSQHFRMGFGRENFATCLEILSHYLTNQGR